MVGLASGFQCQRCRQARKEETLPADSPPPPTAALPLPLCLLHSHLFLVWVQTLATSSSSKQHLPTQNPGSPSRDPHKIYYFDTAPSAEAKMFERTKENTAQWAGICICPHLHLPPQVPTPWPSQLSPQKQVASMGAGRCTVGPQQMKPHSPCRFPGTSWLFLSQHLTGACFPGREPAPPAYSFRSCHSPHKN